MCNQLHAIGESIITNQFWENWNTQLNKHENLPIQNGDEWVNHFSNIFGQQQHMYNKLQRQESTIKDYQKPLDSPITLNELQDQIKSLETDHIFTLRCLIDNQIKK